MEQSWERYLWRHKLLALDPLVEHAGSLRLLDIVVKDGREGWSRRPTLHKIGSMCAFRSDQDMHPDWGATKLQIEQNLQQLVGVKSERSDLFVKGEQLETYSCNSSSGCGILASIASLCKAQVQGSDVERIVIQDVVYEMVDSEFLNELVFPKGRDKALQWKPDISKIKVVSRGADDSENLELWIVTELKYGKRIVLHQQANHETGVVADSSAFTGIPTSAGVTLSSTSSGELVASGTMIPFAFKAIRLMYNEEGGLIKREKDMGKRRPKKRTGVSTELDADSDPLYHMGGLFFRAPEVEGDSSKDVYVHENDLECLRLVGTNEDGFVAPETS